MVSAPSILVRAPGDIPQRSTSRKLNHLFMLKIDGNKMLESAKVPPEWKEQKQFHFTPFSNIEIVIYRKSRMFGWRKPVPVAEYSGRGMDFLDTEQELVDKSGTSRLVVKFDLVAESHADFMKAVYEEMTQPAKVKGVDAAQMVIPIAENMALQASEQSHRTLRSDQDMLRSNDDKRNGNRVELSFSTSSTSGNATVQNAGG
ncbi:hypothetical protein FIBSPDRAFT_980477 [Athelia psychrophila]|uniref:Uncharacterized protein n=1 Tax=Athelia psychrophila TaxID=1759441 RepID=A0A166TC89_9AGAM|nr:hypothetical protein FIBSPDRAFT_980477 [Fibularhizoctonia sp. CBS 109695]